MTKLVIIMGAALGIYIVIRIAVSLASGSPAIGGVQSVDGVTQLGDCPSSPNCQGSQSTRSSQQVQPIAIANDTSQAIPTLVTALEALGGKVVEQNDQYVHATFITTAMGYTDDVELLVDDAAKVVHIRSASRLGHSDLGKNKKRVEEIRLHLEGKL